MELEAHLGGHQGKTHTDEGTLRWAIDKLKVKSMLDVDPEKFYFPADYTQMLSV